MFVTSSKILTPVTLLVLKERQIDGGVASGAGMVSERKVVKEGFGKELCMPQPWWTSSVSVNKEEYVRVWTNGPEKATTFMSIEQLNLQRFGKVVHFTQAKKVMVQSDIPESDTLIVEPVCFINKLCFSQLPLQTMTHQSVEFWSPWWPTERTVCMTQATALNVPAHVWFSLSFQHIVFIS
jgi:hypothetical protein